MAVGRETGSTLSTLPAPSAPCGVGELDDPCAPRATCYRCHKPAPLCLCARIPRVPNRTEVRILQHLRERHHPVGTVRFAELGLERVEVAVHRPDGLRPPDLGPWLTPGTALLYPGPSARDLAGLGPEERPTRLLLLDGTWAQARVLLRSYPEVQSLPRVRLSPEAPGRYRIRREPRPECLSTIESLLGALRILEPGTPGLDALEAAFTAMIDEQEARAQAGERRRRLPRAPRPSGALPAILGTHPERLVLAHGEFCHRRDPHDPARRQDAILQWCARRLGSDERFEAVIRPGAAAPGGELLRHLGLDHATLESGSSPEEFAERWRTFLRPGDQVAVWSVATQEAFVASMGSALSGPDLVLKTAYCNVRHRRAGALEEVLGREGLTFEPEPFAGRAGAIVGQLLAVARFLASLADPTPT